MELIGAEGFFGGGHPARVGWTRRAGRRHPRHGSEVPEARVAGPDRRVVGTRGSGRRTRPSGRGYPRLGSPDPTVGSWVPEARVAGPDRRVLGTRGSGLGYPTLGSWVPDARVVGTRGGCQRTTQGGLLVEVEQDLEGFVEGGLIARHGLDIVAQFQKVLAAIAVKNGVTLLQDP
jgi:hypothetical protein